jgi:hypothetical protein
MVIDFIFKPGEPLRVGAWLAFQHDGASVWHEQPGPNEEHAILPEGDLAVIGAGELRALRDEEIFDPADAAPDPPLPNVEAWYQRLQERPAYRKHVMIPFGELQGRLDY